MVEPTKESVMEILKEVRDPELGFDIVSLGEIEEIKIDKKEKKIIVRVLPTTPLCPYLPQMFFDIESKIKAAYPDYEVEFEIETEKEWTIDRVSPEVRKKLNL